MIRPSHLAYCLALGFLLLPLPGLGEWKGTLRSEAGYHRASFGNIHSQNFLRIKLEGLVKYTHRNNRQLWYIQTRLLPEVYDATGTQWQFFHTDLKGYYLRNGHRGAWEGYVFAKRQNYQFRNFHLTFYTLNIGNRLVWRYTGQQALVVNIGYFHRLTTGKPEITWRAGVVNIGWWKKLFPDLSGRVGIYSESFGIRQSFSGADSAVVLSNNGWRLGPEIMLEYKKHFLMTFQYHWVWHHSRFTERFSGEHWLQAVFGKIIKRRWSLFLLIDYYFRRFHLNEDANPNVVYAPFNTRNRIRIKMERELSPHVELYTTVGYLNENLLIQRIEFSGWRTMLGMQWKR